MNWNDVSNQAQYRTDKTLTQEPSLANRYLEVLESEVLEEGEFFAQLAIKSIERVFFMILKEKPNHFIKVDDKFFKLATRLNVATKTKGVQHIYCYEEE